MIEKIPERSPQAVRSSPCFGRRGVDVTVEFDDIVYKLQRFGGISEYWDQVTKRVASMDGIATLRRAGHRWQRMHAVASRAQVFHSSYFRFARTGGVQNVTTVHDMAYELGHAGHGLKAKLHCFERRRAYFASDALICISHSTRTDLLQVYPALERRCPISVVPHGVSLGPDDALAARPGWAQQQAPFVLFVGGRSSYKNFERALEGFAHSGLAKQGMRLLCTGQSLSEYELELSRRLAVENAVVSVGNVSRADLASLYACAHCLLYPSLFEGFGLPLLEAMRLGCPVVASSDSCIPEVAGDAALLVDARDPQAISEALLNMANTAIRADLIVRGHRRVEHFSWELSARQHAAVYLGLAGISNEF